MNCRCLTFRIYFVLISSHCVNTGSCRSLLGRNKFIYILRGSSEGINQAPIMLWGSPGATCLKFSFNCKYPDAFWTLVSDQTSFGDLSTKEMRIVQLPQMRCPLHSSPYPCAELGRFLELGGRNVKSQVHLPQKRASNLCSRMKGGSSSFGEREEDMALLQPWKTAFENC